MLYNPITNNLYTNEKIFLKKLFCQYKIQWNDFNSIEGSENRHCSMCDKNVMETKSLSDNDLKTLIDNDPTLCIKLEFNQENLRITTDE